MVDYQYAWEDPKAKSAYDPEYVKFYLNDFLPKSESIIKKHQKELDSIEDPVLKLRARSEFLVTARVSYYLPTESFEDEIIVTDEYIPGIDGYRIPIKVYKPKNIEPGTSSAVYINFHGGGYIIGGFKNDYKQNYWLVHLTGITVIDVDYRKVPEWTYSTVFYDAYTSIKYIRDNSAKFGIDPNKVAIGGTSAGAKISIAAAHVARDLKSPVNLVIANVPPVEELKGIKDPKDSRFSGSLIKFIKDPLLNFNRALHFEEARDIAEIKGQRIDKKDLNKYFANVPYLDIYEGQIIDAPNFKDLPKHIVYVGEHDILNDAGKAYARKLIDNGVEVTFRVARGLGHSHANWTNVFDESKEYLHLVVNELKRLKNGDYSK